MDNEIKGEGNSINYKYRMHDPRVGRFFAVDPLKHEYPWNSPYAFSENKVTNHIELEGLEASMARHMLEAANREENGGGYYEPGTMFKQMSSQNSDMFMSNVREALFKKGFDAFLPQRFIEIYSSGQGGTFELSKSQVADLNPHSVSVFRGAKSKNHRKEAAAFIEKLHSIDVGSSKQVKLVVTGQTRTHGTLGEHAVIFEGVLSRTGKGSKDWTFEGTMEVYDFWDFDAKKKGVRSESSEFFTTVGHFGLAGQGFHITSEKIDVKQSGTDSQVDYFNDKEFKDVKNNLTKLTDKADGG